MTVAMPAPTTPIASGKINSASSATLSSAPASMHRMVYCGEPSARTMAVSAGHSSWNGIPTAMVRRYATDWA